MRPLTLQRKVKFLYNSNMIEEIHIPKERYTALDKSPYPEISGHARALEYMLENYEKELGEKDVLIMHGLLTKGLLPASQSGAYRNVPVWIGGRQALQSVIIKPAMERLMVKAAMARTEDQCWEIHDNFEHIHPFVDGNGRTGRLIVNWMRLHNNHPFLTVSCSNEERFAYYANIEARKFDLFDKD